MLSNNSKYLLLALTVILSIILTAISLNLVELIREYFIPYVENCYDIRKDLEARTNDVYRITLIYISFAIIYILTLSLLLIKVLKKINTENVFITLVILVFFNTIIFSLVIYSKINHEKNFIEWCELEHIMCKDSYKFLHNIDKNLSQAIDLEVLI